MNTQRFPKLNSLLRGYVRRYRANCLLAGLGRVAIALLLPLPVGCFLDRFFLLPDFLRVALWVAYVTGACCTVLCWVIVPLVQRHSLLQAAFSLDDRCPELKEAFSVAVQLDEAAQRETHGCSRILVYSAQRQAECLAAETDLHRLLPRRRAWKWCALGAMAAVAQAPLFLAASLQYPQLLARFLNPFGNYARVSGVEVAVLPGSADLGDGERLTVEARVSDPDLARLGLNLAFEGGEPQRYEMARPEPGRFVFVVSNARKNFTYHLSEGLVQTASYRVRVQSRPRLERFHIRYEYPEYTGWPATSEEKQDGNLHALTGTRVTLRVELDCPVEQVLLRKRDGAALPMTLEKERLASIDWELAKSFDFQIVATAKDGGVSNANPVFYTAHAVVDQPPQVTLYEPHSTTKLDPHGTQAIRFEARDEFPIAEARLLVRGAHGDAYRPVEAQGLGEQLVHGATRLSLAELKAEPGDVIGLAVEARDLAGQWGRCEVRHIEVPVAAGDLAAVRQAGEVAPVRQALAELSVLLAQTHSTLAEIAKRMNPPPDKWSRELENHATLLRPSFDALRNQAGLLTGIALRQREEAADAGTRHELAPIVTQASGLEQAVKRFKLESFLIEVRQGFQQDGPEQARAAAQDARTWLESARMSALVLAAFERQLRLRDLSRRARELLEAQQSLLIVGEQGSQARAAGLQRLVLEESRDLLDAMAAVASIEPAAKDLAAGREQALEAVESLSQRYAAGNPLGIEALSGFVALLAGVYKELQGHERKFQELFAKLSRESLEFRSQHLSSATLLQRLSDHLAISVRNLEQDPLDKVDEQERLPPLVARLRRTLQMLQESAGALWDRAEDAPEIAGAAWRRRDLTAMAYRLHRLDRQAGEAVRASGVKIAATFETDAPATPLLPGLRRQLTALHGGLAELIEAAQACDEAERQAEDHPALQRARSALLPSAADRQAELQRQVAEWRSLAGAMQAENIDVLPVLARSRAALGDLRALLGMLATEPACLVLAGQLERARAERLAFLALWGIHQERAFPVLMALDACVAENDAQARQVLLARARALAEETAARLAEATETPSGQESGFAAFVAEHALGPEADRALHHVEAFRTAARCARRIAQAAQQDTAAAPLHELGAMLLPYARKGHAAAHKELEVLIQESCRQAGELADAGRKVTRIGHSAQGLRAAYEELAGAFPAAIERLTADLQAVRTVAERFGAELCGALDEMAGGVRRAREPAARFAAERTPTNGLAAGQALQVPASAESFDALLDARIARQRAHLADHQVLSGQLLEHLRAGFAKLGEIKKRCDAREAERNAAFDAMHAEARKAYKLLWNKEYLECYMKWTPPPQDKPDAGKTPKQRLEEYLDSKGFAGWESYRSGLHFIGLAGFHFMAKETTPRTWKPPFGSYRRGTAVGAYYESTAQEVKKLVARAEKWLHIASERAPEDVELLTRWKTDYQKAHDVLIAGLERWRPHLVPETWKEARCSFAAEIEALERSLQPAIDLLVARAEAKGWKKPAIEVNRRGQYPTTVIPKPPQPDASLESAAHYAFLLGQDLRRVHLYALLGGENDPDADLQRAMKTQHEPVPDDMLGSSAKLAGALQEIMAQVQDQLDSGSELQRELEFLQAERSKLGALAQRYHAMRGKEHALRSALLAAAEGSKALNGRFVRAANSLPHDIARLRNRLDRLLQTAPSLGPAASQLHETQALLAAERWKREAEQLAAALGADRRDQVAELTTAQAAKLEQAASLLRRSLELSEAKDATPVGANAAGSGQASSASRLVAGETWRVVAELSQDEPSEARASACLRVAQDLDRAAVSEIDALGQGFVESAGQAEWKALQSLIRSVSQTVEVAGLGAEAGPQVLGRLQLRPLGQDPSGQHYGRLSPQLLQDLRASSREQRPRELESAWTRYVHGILNPPPAEVATPSPAGGKP